MTFGARLRKARLQQGKTQQQLAQAVGVKQQAIQRIEAGKVKGTSYTVHIAKALTVSAEWLAFGPDDAPMVLFNIEESRAAAYHHQVFSSVPLFAWSEINLALNMLDVSNRQYIPCCFLTSPKAFAVAFQNTDNAMSAPDGKISFQRNDILIVDPAQAPKDGSFVLAAAPKMMVRQYIAAAKENDYLAALNQKYESILCNDKVKIYGTVLEKIHLFG